MRLPRFYKKLKISHIGWQFHQKNTLKGLETWFKVRIILLSKADAGPWRHAGRYLEQVFRAVDLLLPSLTKAEKTSFLSL
jgi:hypothetical protein